MEKVEVTWHEHAVARADRERLNGHRGCVVWFTGLSGCGKSTIANLVDRQLFERGVHTFLLDGDNVRHGLNPSTAMLAEAHDADFAQRFGLGFGPADREENIRRIGAVTELFCSAGLITLAAFVSPYRKDRDLVRQRLEASGGAGDFIEVFVDTPLEVCESRDPKGLYKKARAGELKGMTGIDDPYEAPLKPEITLAGGSAPPDKLATEVIRQLMERGIVRE
ncbi:adenylyl-sulfate kinase [Blastopirellula marina]|uniref:Adenylyl-sulfate kinase n=1 Tax=Blastopirellula marina TaxID=124 RepID=A0A2S8GRY2_9BACT|nr:adenylyl-sulfate kinase [Blastopirellula marina]PQO26300.1 adenylyl-sulfate kinase [Blastopirellula marina]PQO47180.1 adenylyl-sulfate kinase [Blastopirellula marina]PTL40700.1 adenylyl-sulfate kinase [Blastopirellula marina]